MKERESRGQQMVLKLAKQTGSPLLGHSEEKRHGMVTVVVGERSKEREPWIRYWCCYTMTATI